MAKGFSVKPTVQKKKGREYDIPAIKERMKGKTIAICLPGQGVSYAFLKNFVQLCFEIVQNNMGIAIQQDYSSVVNFARCKVLGASVTRGRSQKPWNGQLEYDYQLWIDSDIIFNANQFWALCDTALPETPPEREEPKEEDCPHMNLSDEELNDLYEAEKNNAPDYAFTIRKERVRRLMLTGNPIVAGYYLTADGHTTSCAHWLSAEDFVKNGGVMDHETADTIIRSSALKTVDYTGFGWVLVQKGVFENMLYPWFPIKLQEFPNGVTDFCGEDVGFCLDAKELGMDIIVDPQIRVLHEKIRYL